MKGALDYMLLKERNIKKKLWRSREILKVFSRRFLMGERGIEIFTSENKVYYFNLYTPKIQKEFLDKLEKEYSHVKVIVNRKRDFEKEMFQDQWRKGQLSNFEYLMLVNSYASRSYNDIS